MDSRLRAIGAVIILEAILRSAYGLTAIDPMIYTLLARLLELLLILGLAAPACGLQAGSLKKELLVGIAVAALFGGVVLALDLVSRLALSGGVLRLFLVKPAAANPGLFVFVGCIAAPFVEELFFRGLFYAWLRQRLPMFAAVIVSAAFFATMHGFLSPVQLIGGLAFAALFEWRGNIWAAYVLHASANFGLWFLPFFFV